MQLLFGIVPVGDMFQKKIDEVLNRIPNSCSIADDIVIAGLMN